MLNSKKMLFDHFDNYSKRLPSFAMNLFEVAENLKGYLSIGNLKMPLKDIIRRDKIISVQCLTKDGSRTKSPIILPTKKWYDYDKRFLGNEVLIPREYAKQMVMIGL